MIDVTRGENCRAKERLEKVRFAGIKHPMALCERTRSRGKKKTVEDFEYPKLRELWSV